MARLLRARHTPIPGSRPTADSGCRRNALFGECTVASIFRPAGRRFLAIVSAATSLGCLISVILVDDDGPVITPQKLAHQQILRKKSPEGPAAVLDPVAV